MSVEEFRQVTLAALQPPSAGVVFYNWPKLDEDEARYQVAKTIIKNLRKN